MHGFSKLDKPLKNEIISRAVDKVVMALGKNSISEKIVPKFHYDKDFTTVEWQDGTKSKVKNIDLRLSCRCAVCVNELTGEKVLRSEDVPADIQPKEILVLGNYALGIKWSDGHTSGIYPYASIKKLAK